MSSAAPATTIGLLNKWSDNGLDRALRQQIAKASIGTLVISALNWGSAGNAQVWSEKHGEIVADEEKGFSGRWKQRNGRAYQ